MTSTPHLTLVRDRADVVEGQDDEHAGPDGTAANPSYQDRAETCARHADELADLIEQVVDRMDDLMDAVQDGEVVSALRIVFHVRAALRPIAMSFGELHTELDEMSAS